MSNEVSFSTRNNSTIAGQRWVSPLSTATRPARVGILLHGWLDNASSFDLLAPLLLRNHTTNQGFDELIALDLAGHGKSDHSYNGIYHPGEHVADVADVLYELGWFTDHQHETTAPTTPALPQIFVIGHSMGGGIAALFCGTFPQQITGGLCMLEAIGPWPDMESNAAKNLCKSILSSRRRRLSQNTRQPRIFPSHNAAALRRSQGNVVGTLPIAAALILCRRGLKKLEVPLLSGNAQGSVVDGYVWSTDPALMGPSRLKYSPGQSLSFCKRLQCPTMVLTVSDGIMRRSTRWLGSGAMWASGVGVLIRIVLVLVKTLQCIESLLVRMEVKSQSSKMLIRVAYGLTYGLGLRARLKTIKRVTMPYLFSHAIMKEGGHHPQLTKPAEVAMHVLDFLQRVPKDTT